MDMPAVGDASQRGDRQLARNVRLICIPSGDGRFAAHAQALLAELPAELEGEAARLEFERLLKVQYEDAVVRQQDPLAAVGPPGQVVWYATNRRYRSRIIATVEIAAPPELVFRIYTERFAEWQTAVSIRRTVATTELVGTVYVATYQILGRTFEGRFRIVDADPPHSVRVEAEGVGGIRVWYVTSFRPTDGGTLVEVAGDYDLPSNLLAGITGLAVERAIARDVERAHASLRDLCQRESGAATDSVA